MLFEDPFLRDTPNQRKEKALDGSQSSEGVERHQALRDQVGQPLWKFEAMLMFTTD